MAIKLVAIDLDDTLLNDSLEVSAPTRESIRRAQEQGVAITLSTGRMFSSAMLYAKTLQMKHPLITYNGGMVKYPEGQGMLFHQPIAPEVGAEVVELFREKGWYLQSYVDDKLYVPKRCATAIYYEEHTGIPALEAGDGFYTMRHEATKMLCIAEPALIKSIQAVLQEKYGPVLCAVTSKPHYLELTAPGINKGRSLDFLARHLNIRQEEVMAIGDSNNDYDMIEYAGWGVAMGNASQRLKDCAQAVTASNNEHGVAAAIEKYVLNG